jgi:hypothetical protein
MPKSLDLSFLDAGLLPWQSWKVRGIKDLPCITTYETE